MRSETMQLLGANLIGDEPVAGNGRTFRGVDPSTGEPLEPEFGEANAEHVDQAAHEQRSRSAERGRDPA